MQQKAGKESGQQGFLNKLRRLSNPRSITLNKRLLIFSFFLLLSVIFWFITALSKNYNASISYPVRYTKMPESKVLISDMPEKLRLSVNAQGYNLLRHRLKSRIVPIIFDVNSFRLSRLPGRDSSTVYILTSIAHTTIARQLSADIELLDISPDSLIFQFADVIKKTVPVQGDFDLNFDQQFMQVGSMILEPDSIIVTGPESILDTLSAVKTKQRGFKNISESLGFEAELERIDRVRFNKDEVRVSVPVEKFTEANLQVPVEIVNLPDSLKIKLFPSQVRLTCRVGLSDYEMVTPESFRIVASYHDIEDNIGEKLPVKLLVVPEFVQSVSYHPRGVEYIIEK